MRQRLVIQLYKQFHSQLAVCNSVFTVLICYVYQLHRMIICAMITPRQLQLQLHPLFMLVFVAVCSYMLIFIYFIVGFMRGTHTEITTTEKDNIMYIAIQLYSVVKVRAQVISYQLLSHSVQMNKQPRILVEGNSGEQFIQTCAVSILNQLINRADQLKATQLAIYKLNYSSSYIDRLAIQSYTGLQLTSQLPCNLLFTSVHVTYFRLY